MYMKLKLNRMLFLLVYLLVFVLCKADGQYWKGFHISGLDEEWVEKVNLLRNPSFEKQNLFDKPVLQLDIDEPIMEWDALGGWPGVILPGTISVEGNMSVLFFANSFGGKAWLSQRGIHIRAGKQYLVQGWFRTVLPHIPENSKLGAYVKVWGSSKEKPLFEKWLSGISDWQQVNGIFMAPDGTEYITLDIGLEGLRGYFWADDFRISEIKIGK